MLDIPAAELLRIQSTVPPVPPSRARDSAETVSNDGPFGFGPVVDGINLPAHPFDPAVPDVSKHKPLMVGWNEDEYTFFAWQRKDTSAIGLDLPGLEAKLETQYGADTKKIMAAYRSAMPDASPTEIFMAIASISMMGLGSIEIAEKKVTQNGAPVYLYNFGYKSEAKIPGTDYALGTPHAMDITFKFNNEALTKDRTEVLSGRRPERLVASHHMAELWTTFARTGIPAAADVPDWPAYNLEDRPSMRIDTSCEVIYDRFSQELAMWRSIGRL